MPKYVIENSAMLRFYQNLSLTLRENPELGIDLANPDHCGLVRMADPGEKYAMMPMEGGRYVDNAPGGDEDDPDWMLRNQRGLTVSAAEIETELPRAQLDAIYAAAQDARLYAVIPDEVSGRLTICADETGEVGFLRSEDGAVTAESRYRDAYWSARFNRQPGLTKQEFRRALEYSENAMDGLGRTGTEEFLSYAVYERGTVHALFTPEELSALGPDGTNRRQTGACARLWTAAQSGDLFYRSPADGKKSRVVREGAGFRETDLETIPQPPKPGLYEVKRLIRRAIPRAFPQVAAYETGLKAAAALRYYASTQLDDRITKAKRKEEEEARRRRERLKYYYLAEDHKTAEEKARKQALAAQNRRNAPRNALSDLGLTDSDMAALVESLEKANGPLPKQMKENLRTLYDQAESAVKNLSEKCERGGSFRGGRDVWTIVVCREVRNLLTDSQQLTPEVVGFFSSDKCVDNCMQLASVSGNVKYASELMHDADFFRQRVLDDKGCDALAGKLNDSVRKVYAEKAAQNEQAARPDSPAEKEAGTGEVREEASEKAAGSIR